VDMEQKGIVGSEEQFKITCPSNDGMAHPMA
jgi:hypothetical protein